MIAKWSGRPGGAERKNFQPFIMNLVTALGLEEPEPGQAGKLGDYEFEATVDGGSAKLTGAGGSADLYKRGCFVMEAKQSYLPPGERSPDQSGNGTVVPITPARATYDRLMVRAQGQARNYAVNLPGDHPSVPFLIVCDVGRAFELFYDYAGNGRSYAFFPDKQRYRIPLAQLREPETQALFRAIWTDPRSLDPQRRSVPITADVSRKLAQITQHIESSTDFRRELAERGEEATQEVALFLMRLLFCMFAEDIGLLPKGRFLAFLQSCVPDQVHSATEPLKADRFQQGLAELWNKMAVPSATEQWSWVVEDRVRYFNGGLFENRRVFPLDLNDVYQLIEAAKRDWRAVEPAIFGALLEQALDPGLRAKLGAHYTPRAYVERLVDATIMEVLNAEWEDVISRQPGLDPGLGFSSGDAVRESSSGPGQARADGKNVAGEDLLDRALAFHRRLASVTVLDPACGTGNFLYVAMEAIERLEARVIETIQQLGGRAEPLVGPHQFFGLEKNPRAAKIAELVLWIGWLRFRIDNAPESVPEPVLARGANINFGRAGGYDAVLRQTAAGEPDLETPLPAEWPEAEFIVGNPPFIGGKDMRGRLDPPGYAEAVWKANPRVPPSADFVMQWWDRAAHLLTAPGARLRRFGFVTTNSITQEFSRRVIARYLSSPFPAGEGDSPQASGVRGAGAGRDGHHSPSPGQPVAGSTSPHGRGGLRLVFAVPDHPWTKAGKDAAAVRIAMTVAERGAGPGVFAEVTHEAALDSDAPQVELSRTVAPINANLAIGADAGTAVPLRANEGLSSRGVALHGAGFIVTPAQAAALGLGRVEGLERHVRPYRNGRDLLGTSRDVLVIDLFGLSEREARQRFPDVYQHLLATVKPERDTNRRDTRRLNWWLFGELAPAFRDYSTGLPRYIATVETAKHRLFHFLDAEVLPDNMLVAIGSDDAFHLGVLSSRIHTDWALRAGGWLGVGNDSRYSKSKVFDPFPFPDAPPEQRAAIAELAEELDATRKAVLAEVPKLTMTELYNLRAALAAGTLDAAGTRRAHASRAGVIDRIHAQIDAAVAAAYGWPDRLPPSEIVARLVTLNAERAREEAEGLVRWLRPEFQVREERSP